MKGPVYPGLDMPAPQPMDIGALMIRMQFGGVFYTITIIRNHQNNLGPYITQRAVLRIESELGKQDWNIRVEA